MMTSSRPREAGESFASRRGHGNQLSISDPSHHVTEAIGTLYGDSDDDSLEPVRRESRPLSFIAAPFGGEQIQKFQRPRLQPSQSPTATSPLEQRQLAEEQDGQSQQHESEKTNEQSEQANSSLSAPGINGGNKRSSIAQALPLRTASQGGNTSPYDGSVLPPLQPMSPISPTLSLRDVQSDPQGVSQFPLTNIDNPNDIAQELSNLQALRRMSMDVSNSADPDLMPFQSMSLMAMPSIAPSGEDDEGDVNRLLWVPAKVHPELAPEQFKNFLENRVQSIKRRSGESTLSADGLSRANSEGLRRKKSTLSHQLDSATAETGPVGSDDSDNAELSLNALVKDPSKVVQRLTQDTQRQGNDGVEKSSLDDDKPILPVPSMGLRRSTRTTYRKGGSLRGDRAPFSKRLAASRQVERDGEKLDVDEPSRSSLSSEFDTLPPSHLSESVTPENLSVSARLARGQPQSDQQDGSWSASTVAAAAAAAAGATAASGLSGDDAARPSSTSSAPAVTYNLSSSISTSSDTTFYNDSATTTPSSAQGQVSSRPFPQRSSSQTASQVLAQSKPGPNTTQPQAAEDYHQSAPPRSNKRSQFGWPGQQQQQQPQSTLNDMAQHPSALPGSGSTRTDSLTFIPTLSSDDRKSDKKSRDKDDGEGSKSMSWKWFKSEDRKKKDKEKEKDEHTKKSRVRNLQEKVQPDKGHDGARLDVLQSSIDNASSKGRESILIERDSIDNKLHEERKKETSRRSGEPKKEKDGFFGSIFGGSRRKEGKDSDSNRSSGGAGTGAGRGKQRATSPETHAVTLRPDIDYPYTRFPIVEERAIYRMAHIKLANPRRDLQSQVLLSNFMYSYLAKVQAMHPQLNVPTSPQQKRQDEERKRREQELQQQQYLEQQMMMQQQSQGSVDQYNFEYHRYGDSNQHQNDGGSVDYIDDAQIFDYDHGSQQHNSDGSMSQHQNHDDGYGNADHNQGHRGYYDYDHADDDRRGDNEMW